MTLPSTSSWISATKSEPCPICQNDHWCGWSSDRAVVHCMRVESEKAIESGGWMHRFIEKKQPRRPRRVGPAKKRLTDDEQHAIWAPQARLLREGAGAAIQRLAIDLSVAEWTLNVLHVGYGELAGRMCWSFPELNWRGQVVGINRRLVTPVDANNQRAAPGGRRGLTYEKDWADHAGPVFIVEGGSDTAAGLTLGLSVIGRQSNVGGLRDLVPLLRKLTSDRRIIVFAERDRKRHEDLKPAVQKSHDPKCRGCMLCWPGSAGAKQTADVLSKRLGRRVEWWFLPGDTKDLRAWLNSQTTLVDCISETNEVAGRLLRCFRN